MNLRKESIKIIYEIKYKFKNKSLKKTFQEHILKLNIHNTKDIFVIKKYCYGVIRNKLYIDYLISSLKVSKNRTNKFAFIILELAIFESLFLSQSKNFVIVNESCNTAKELKLDYLVGFINATLKNFLKNKIALKLELRKIKKIEDVNILSKYISIKYSYSEYLVNYLFREFGIINTLKFCAWNNREPLLSIRMNCLKTNVQNFQKVFDDIGAEIKPIKVLDDFGFNLKGIKDFSHCKTFLNGDFFIQDDVSQLVGFIINAKPNDLILDACSSPGGKLSFISSSTLNTAKVIALDINEFKLNKVRENINRLGLTNIECYCSDFLDFNYDESFDKIIVDAPCSGLGVLNKHLDGKFIEKNFSKFAILQKQMLLKASYLLKIDGYLIYSVCTITREETDDILNDFLLNNNNFVIDDIKPYLPLASHKFIDNNGSMKILPFRDRMSAFYCFRLKKLN